MPDAEELKAARLFAPLALAELSLHDISSPTSPPSADISVLRLCLQLLPVLNDGDPSLATRCCRGLLASLGAILSRDPSPSLLPAIEVFAENLVFSERLRSCLAMADCVAPEGSRIFSEALPCQGEHHLVLELVCHHFMSSFQGEGGFEVFLRALSLSENELQGTPKISFQGSLALIHRTCLFSLPAVIEAHLLQLTSRCINVQNLDLHLLAFEHAIHLYVRYLPALNVFNRTGGVKTPLGYVKERPFSCCIKDATNQKLQSQINGLLSFCQLHSSEDLPTEACDIDRLIEENQHLLDEKFRQESTLVLKNILSHILCYAKQKEVLESDAEVSDRIICLAAVLRVMSCSLLHILQCFSQMRSANDATLCKVYNVVDESICLLGQHEANELHRYDLVDIIRMSVDRKRAPMLILAHFSTLSVYCVRRRLGFLWKGCISMMIMSVNLIAEEERLGAFLLSTDVSKELAAFCNTEERILEVSAQTKAIALRYGTILKVQKGRHVNEDGKSLGTSRICKSTIGKANGQAFLECHPEYSQDWNDIIGFVECEEGKDYKNTLMQQRKFRDFKLEKWDQKRKSNKESTRDTLGFRLKSRRL